VKIVFYISLLYFIIVCNASAGVINGTVTDSQTGESISSATIRVEGTGKSIVTNQAGQYRIRLDAGNFLLKFSHVAYYSDTIFVQSPDSAISVDIKLRPSVHLLRGMRVYDRKYDPAQEIIIEAIARKEKLLARLRSYSFEAYTRALWRDRKKQKPNDIIIITETQLKSFWEPPNKHKEIITARKQSANFSAEQNLYALGEIIDFNENRIDFGVTSVVSPTAKDALDYYNYYLTDTLFWDSLAIFRLEIEPKTQATPLFMGTIDIADSSYAIVGVDVGFNKAFPAPMISNIHYAQKCAPFDSIWMPIEVKASVDVDVPLVNLQLEFEMLASLHNYNIDVKSPQGTFDDYVYEIAENADDIDSVTWDSGQIIPLTPDEIRGYQRIDSIEKAPKPFRYYLARGIMAAIYIPTFMYDWFHYNRVEGAYLGVADTTQNKFPGVDVKFKTGWAFSQKYWEHDYGLTYTLHKKWRLKAGLEYHDRTMRRNIIITGPYGNPTFSALLVGEDPYDYYLEKGFSYRLQTKVISHRLELSANYNDFLQYSLDRNTRYSFFGENTAARSNISIIDGHLRSLTGRLRWRTTELVKNKKNETTIASYPYSSLTLETEMASPKLIKNDFNYHRHSLRFYHSRQIMGWGISTFDINGGMSEGGLPPQRHFVVDCATSIFYEGLSFKTMGDSNFSGDWAVSAYYQHNFGRSLFLKSGIPLIRDIPLSFAIHGGMFFNEFNREPLSSNQFFNTTLDKPYKEIGFGIGGIPPLMLGCYFTWQLSDYPTNKFSWQLGLMF
jgi:hypothetical protein